MAPRFLASLLLMVCGLVLTAGPVFAFQCGPAVACGEPVTPVCDQPIVPMGPCCQPSPLFPPPPPLVVPVIIPPAVTCAPPAMVRSPYDQPPPLPSQAGPQRPPRVMPYPMR